MLIIVSLVGSAMSLKSHEEVFKRFRLLQHLKAAVGVSSQSLQGFIQLFSNHGTSCTFVKKPVENVLVWSGINIWHRMTLCVVLDGLSIKSQKVGLFPLAPFV
jgi:hypothetical protein